MKRTCIWVHINPGSASDKKKMPLGTRGTWVSRGWPSLAFPKPSTDVPLGTCATCINKCTYKCWPALVRQNGKSDMPMGSCRKRTTNGWPALSRLKRTTNMPLSAGRTWSTNGRPALTRQKRTTDIHGYASNTVYQRIACLCKA